MFQAMHYVKYVLGLKCQKFKQACCKDVGLTKLEFVASVSVSCTYNL